MRGRVLIVDDDQEMCAVLETGLNSRGFASVSRTSVPVALELLQTTEFDVVVTDLNMRGVNGIEFCSRTTENHPDIPVVVITAFGSLDTAVASIRAGAYDFITKPFETEQLALALDRAVQHRALRAEVKRLRRAVAGSHGIDDLIGESPEIRVLRNVMSRAADADASILITGESGTGKEVVAQSLHRLGRRPGGPFIAVNCAAMPEPLLESELFGHVRGAFTDAKSDRQGLFVQAHGGTLFLDEIGTMPLALQPKLLRALQDRRVRPVGGDVERSFDARIIAATNCDLETEVHEGRFRSDLYYRINVIHLSVPALRTRSNDVLLLAQHFIQEFAARSGKHVIGLSGPVAPRLVSYPWPGNVRELQNCIERAVALTAYEQITVEDLPDRIREYRPSHVLLASDDPTELVSMHEVERRYVQRVLEAVGGNKTIAARILGFDRKTLYRKLDEYQTPNPAGDSPPERLQSASATTELPASAIHSRPAPPRG